MEIKYGLISCDSHAQMDRDNWTSRMSKAKWGDAIPQVVETSDPANIVVDWGLPVVDRWLVNGVFVGDRGVSNCPTVMDDPMRKYFPQRWEEVPRKVYDPVERLKALDEDGVDAEVLFPNDPVQGGTFLQGSAEFELACIQAYNDGLGEWRQVSDRFIPLANIPMLCDIETTVAEVERAANMGHRGINMVAEPRSMHKDLPHFNDPYWYPLWEACQALEMPVHWHSGAGLKLNFQQWKGYTRNESQAMGPTAGFSSIAQFIPNLIFSGVLDRYPTLQWVCAETGLGWVNYILEGCDHEWRRRHLWSEGILNRPSDLFRRQVYVDFWYEEAGVEMRHEIGIDRILWESDYPHSTSTFPESWKFVDRSLTGVPQDEREVMLYRNALKLYAGG